MGNPYGSTGNPYETVKTADLLMLRHGHGSLAVADNDNDIISSSSEGSSRDTKILLMRKKKHGREGSRHHDDHREERRRGNPKIRVREVEQQITPSTSSIRTPPDSACLVIRRHHQQQQQQNRHHAASLEGPPSQPPPLLLSATAASSRLSDATSIAINDLAMKWSLAINDLINDLHKDAERRCSSSSSSSTSGSDAGCDGGPSASEKTAATAASAVQLLLAYFMRGAPGNAANEAIAERQKAYVAAQQQQISCWADFERKSEALVETLQQEQRLLLRGGGSSSSSAAATAVPLHMAATLGAHRALAEWYQYWMNGMASWANDIRETAVDIVSNLRDRLEQVVQVDTLDEIKHIEDIQREYLQRLENHFLLPQQQQAEATAAAASPPPTLSELRNLYAKYRAFLTSARFSAAYGLPLVLQTKATVQVLDKEIAAAAGAEAALELLRTAMEDIQDTLEIAAAADIRRSSHQSSSAVVAASFEKLKVSYQRAAADVQYAQACADQAARQLIRGWHSNNTTDQLDRLHKAHAAALEMLTTTKQLAQRRRAALIAFGGGGGTAAAATTSTPQRTDNNVNDVAAATDKKKTELLQQVRIEHYTQFLLPLFCGSSGKGTAGGGGVPPIASSPVLSKELYYRLRDITKTSAEEAQSNLRISGLRAVESLVGQSKADWAERAVQLRSTWEHLQRVLLRQRDSLQALLTEQKHRLVKVYDISSPSFVELEKMVEVHNALCAKVILAGQMLESLKSANALAAASCN